MLIEIGGGGTSSARIFNSPCSCSVSASSLGSVPTPRPAICISHFAARSGTTSRGWASSTFEVRGNNWRELSAMTTAR